ncbi:GNAT family N-acetyltransferase [Gracilibacillus alcaliphilus]|uniref:GNAT family N-acetyltransferase n=1 Tax=Gracilibacillus alcaliphilus TaxID=1401441 RepID=UPI00195EF41D|nr:GNAT family N-acetyltransferase [Gracilibacillus alcaliphilus]MBM7676204.1 aminoglycoside 3-N-acetyltransferase I [Gracilibacillus alcaliphilus]
MNYKIEFRRLQTGDEQSLSELVELYNQAFETSDQVNTKGVSNLLANPHFICLVAFDCQQVIGGLTAYELEMYNQSSPSVYVYDLAVAASYQRQGIGTRLFQEMIDYCKRYQITDLFVQADAEDQHAIQFYHKIGGEESMTFHFTFRPFQP